MRALIARTDMFPPGATVVAAVSGGQDSCAMLHALALLRGELGIAVHAAHLNHGIRFAEADGDAAFVAEFAHLLSIECTLGTEDVPALAHRMHTSLEMAARQARHAFLERVAAETGATRIALGHTRDDRVETVLLNIMRGAGIDGLRGLTPINGMRARPLLEVARDETAAYCRDNGIAFREDSTNKKLAYTRNLVRLELLPLMEAYINSTARSTILRLSDLASEDAEYMNKTAEDAYPLAVSAETADSVALSADALALIPLAIRRRVIRLAIGRIRGDLQGVNFNAVQRALIAMESGVESSYSLSGGDMRIGVTSKEITVARVPARVSVRHINHYLVTPGETHLPDLNVSFRVTFADAPQDVPREPPVDRVTLDADAVRLPLVIRNWRQGDSFQPLGMSGTRKLQDLLTDRKVPKAERGLVPIIEDADGIIWVVAHAISERVKLTTHTSRTIVIERI